METQGPVGRLCSPRSGKSGARGLFVPRKNHKRLAGEEEGRGAEWKSAETRARASSQRRRRLMELPKKTAKRKHSVMRSLFPLADQKQGAADRLSAPATLPNTHFTAPTVGPVQPMNHSDQTINNTITFKGDKRGNSNTGKQE